jgi:flagellar motility protein MotE (MotC chaperone)
MVRRIRLLPAVIFCAAFILTLKLSTIWQDVSGWVGANPAVAEEKPAKAAAGDGGKAQSDKPGPKAGNGQKAAAQDASSGAGKANRTNTWFDPAMVTDSELEVLQKLSDRRAELDKRQRQLETRARLLQATERRIDAKLTQLKTMQETITKLLRKHDQQKEEQMKSVVKIYENMKPKEAARIFEELDMKILLDVIERMREARAAPIMANMTPLKAKAVTAALAQRRMLPKPDSDDRK